MDSFMVILQECMGMCVNVDARYKKKRYVRYVVIHYHLIQPEPLLENNVRYFLANEIKILDMSSFSQLIGIALKPSLDLFLLFYPFSSN